MSNWEPHAAKMNIGAIEYKVAFGKPSVDDPPILKRTIGIYIENVSEIINWAAFFQAYLGKGIVCFTNENGEFSYPPDYLQGSDIASLPSNVIYELDMLNSNESFAFAMKYADDELIHILFLNFLDDINPLEKEGADFDDIYTQADDDIEIYESSNALFIKSHDAITKNDYRKSLDYLNKVIDENPNYSRAYSARGSVYYYFQDYRYAMANYFDAIDINPRNWRAYYNAGVMFFDIGKRLLGQKYLERSLEYNCHFIAAVQTLARNWFSIGEYGEAVKAVAKGLVDNPDNEELLEENELLLAEVKKHQEQSERMLFNVDI